MGALDKRLERLEHSGSECSECGHGGSSSSPEEIIVVWSDLDGNSQEEAAPTPEFCPECGRQLIFTIRWLDLEDSP